MPITIANQIKHKINRKINRINWLSKEILDGFKEPFYQFYYGNCCITDEDIQIYGQYTGKSNFQLTILKNDAILPENQIQVIHCHNCPNSPDFLVKIKNYNCV